MEFPRRELIPVEPVHPPCLIFHSAFCASTLLASALSNVGIAMSLSEPVILNDVAGIARRREVGPDKVAQLLQHVTTLLARPWGVDEKVIIKPSCVINPHIATVLQRSRSNAILLHAPLETFLTSVARKGIWTRLWVRELLEGLLADGAVRLGFESSDYFRLTDLQCAAVGWLANAAMFNEIATKFGRQRVATLDSESFLDAPEQILDAAARHFALRFPRDNIQSVVNGELFQRHSKSNEAFSSKERSAQYALAKEAHRDEIEKVTAWASAVASKARVDLDAWRNASLLT